MKIGLERLLRVSSRLLVRRQRSYVIHIVTADSAEFSGHGVNTNVDVLSVEHRRRRAGMSAVSCSQPDRPALCLAHSGKPGHITRTEYEREHATGGVPDDLN